MYPPCVGFINKYRKGCYFSYRIYTLINLRCQDYVTKPLIRVIYPNKVFRINNTDGVSRQTQ